MGLLGKGLNEAWLAGRKLADLIKEGYPESVAKRIIDGDLPMDEASRKAREDAFGIDAYHLTNKDFKEFKTGTDIGEMGFDGTSGDAIWLGATPQQRYPAAHNVYQPTNEKELLEALIKMDVDPEHKAIGSNVMPLKLKSDDYLAIDEFNIDDMRNRYAGGDNEFPWMVTPETAERLRKDGFDSIHNEVGMWDDDWTADKAELISLYPENIRSKYAAFDPEYTGPNILGSRIAPTVATGLLGGAGLYTALKSNKATANPIDELRAAERDFGLSDVEKLRASEREFVEPNYNQAKLYDEANTLWQNTGQTLKNIGAPDLAVDLFTPTFESSRDKAMGDKSTMTNIFAALEKLDPTAYAGLLGALARRGMN